MSTFYCQTGKRYVRRGQWKPFVRIDQKPDQCAHFGVGFLWPLGTVGVCFQFANYIFMLGLSDWKEV